jgi:hypothetical protein
LSLREEKRKKRKDMDRKGVVNVKHIRIEEGKENGKGNWLSTLGGVRSGIVQS